MRGLETVVLMAKSRIADFIYGEDARNEIALDAFSEAVREGISDYHSGINLPPAVYSEDEDLIGAWHMGWDLAAEVDEDRCCECFEDGICNTCPIHGCI